MNHLPRSPRAVHSDADAVVKEALSRLPQPSRRAFLGRTLTLGGLSMMSGCSLLDDAGVESALRRISSLNDGVQAWLFDPNRLAPTYPESMITRPFPFNAYYGEDEVREIDGGSFRLEVTGLVADKRRWSLADLNALPQTDQITRHVCVEGWSAIGSWQGVELSEFLKRLGADTRAKYVWFQCADKDGYNSPLDMATALHPQTQMTFKFADEILPRAYGFPMKIRVPTKLGFKNPKYVVAMEVTNTDKGGDWEDLGYNWFSGL